jgi:AcrR family transcriptional regulator
VLPNAGPGGEAKSDARAERWRDHRVKVRAEFVNAAFRALDALGPDVSMGDIAREAGAAKPKLYRHFRDKSDLYGAIVERLRDMLWERILSTIDLTRDPAEELVRCGITEYVQVVDEHPNVFRWLVHGRHLTPRPHESDRAFEMARRTISGVAGLAMRTFGDGRGEHGGRAPGLDAGRAELATSAVFGAVATATEWWLGANDRAMPVQDFARYVNVLVVAMVDATLAEVGLTFDTNRPLPQAFTPV